VAHRDCKKMRDRKLQNRFAKMGLVVSEMRRATLGNVKSHAVVIARFCEFCFYGGTREGSRGKIRKMKILRTYDCTAY